MEEDKDWLGRVLAVVILVLLALVGGAGLLFAFYA